MHILLIIALLISTLYVIISITNVFNSLQSLAFPFVDIFGNRKITRTLDSILIYLSVLLQAYFWLYK